MKVFVVLSMLVAVAIAQLPKEQYAPIPYSFNYISETEDGGKSGHEESGDGSGRVTGSYTVTNLEGHTRVVDYIADAEGFRATIRSNEPGTENKNPADVTMESSAAAAGPVMNTVAHLPIRGPRRPAAEAGPVLNTYASPPIRGPQRPAAEARSDVRYVLVPINA